MFFVFENGSPQEGAAAGGLGDLKFASDSLKEAKAHAEACGVMVEDVDILDGSNGDVWSRLYGQGDWYVSPLGGSDA
jgi:hypothetical protein